MTDTVLTASDGTPLTVTRGASFLVTAWFTDAGNQPLLSASFDSLTVTFVREADNAIIKGWDRQSVLGLLEDGEGLDLENPNDDAAVLVLKVPKEVSLAAFGANPGRIEFLRMILAWSWTDLDSTEMHGRSEYRIRVRETAV